MFLKTDNDTSCYQPGEVTIKFGDPIFRIGVLNGRGRSKDTAEILINNIMLLLNFNDHGRNAQPGKFFSIIPSCSSPRYMCFSPNTES